LAPSPWGEGRGEGGKTIQTETCAAIIQNPTMVPRNRRPDFLNRRRHAEKIILGFEAKARGGPLQFGAIFIFSIRLHLFGMESYPKQNGWPENSFK
jgi:hypothetical protein